MAQRLYEKERDKIVQTGLHSLNEDQDKKLQRLMQNLNIERSTKVNEVRLKKMTERNNCVEKIRTETREQLQRNVINPANPAYRTAVKNLIIQSMIKLLEPTLLVKCRKEDLQMVREIIPECEKYFLETMKREASGDKEYKTKLQLVEGEHLTPENGGGCGGIILTSLDKRIVCNNTLESRLELCFEELLPHIRRILFPPKIVEPSPVATPETEGERKSHAATPDSQHSAKHHK